MNDARVRDALAAIAGEVEGGEPGALWDRTQGRIATRRRRRTGRVLAAGAAAIVLFVAAVAVVARDGGQPVTAGLTAVAVPDEILAVVGADVVVVSSADGSVARILIDGVAGAPSPEVSVGARALVYTRVVEPPPNPECTVDPSDLIGPAGRIVTASGAFAPIVSPDGAFVAYRVSECDAPSAVGLTALGSTENYQIGPDEQSETDSVPLAWMPDSQSLLVSLAGSFEIVSVPLGEDRRSVDLPSGTYRAVFVSDDEVAIAYPGSVAIQNVESGERREVSLRPGNVTSLSFDEESRALLIGGEGALEVVHIDSGDSGVVKVPGLTSGLWLRVPVSLRAGEVPGLESIEVPNVRGLARVDAAAALAELGFEVAFLGEGPIVIEQDPAPGVKIEPGSVVTLTLGGVVQPLAAVPDVEGLGVPAALAALEGAGFTVSTESIASGGSDADTVFWQEPPAGSVPIHDRPVTIWACGPTARCVIPPPSYVDGFEPATDWRPIDLAEQRWAVIAGSAYPDADAVGAAVADRLGVDFEQDETVSSTANASKTSAEVWVRPRGFPDDSVYGQDYRLRAELREGGWVLISGEIREVCARGGETGASCF